MKQSLTFCLLSILILSCSVDDKVNDFYLVTLPVEAVTMPEAFVTGETYQVGYRYKRLTTCHIFNNLYYKTDGNQRTVAVINSVYEKTGSGNPCENLEEEIINRTFEFKALNQVGDNYNFRFWQGKDETGNDIYLEMTVPVVEQ